MAISKSEDIEVNVSGSSSALGRYPKISAETTKNMFISDSWLINYAGFKKKTNILPADKGRGLFNSARGGFLIAVVGAAVYRLNADLTPNQIGTLATSTGDISIDENLNSQICIVDGRNAYIYNYGTIPPTFTQQILMFSGNVIFPNYVAYHNTFFLFGSSIESINNQFWYAFNYNPATPTALQFNSQFSLQTKPDVALVVERLPGRGNNVLVLGSTVGEVWTQVGGTENYRRVQSFNIDNGIVSSSTVAASEEFLCWLSQNENNSPVIMYTDGASTKRISTDGIDYILQGLQYPAQSTAFFYRQDGHLFYQITFYNPVDNLTLIYDFNTNLFFHVTDENLNFYPARQIAYYNENTYFISLNDGSLYLVDTNLATYDYDTLPTSIGFEIPRVRICKAIRKKNSDRFRVGKFSFWIAQGNSNYQPPNPVIPRIDFSFSKNGGMSFSNVVSIDMFPNGIFRNIVHVWRLGQCNEIIFQLRFNALGPIICNSGIAEIY